MSGNVSYDYKRVYLERCAGLDLKDGFYRENFNKFAAQPANYNISFSVRFINLR